jgi:hypothetical protein
MSEGFDYQAFKASQVNSNPDRALIVTFEPVAERKPDGTFQNVEFIRIKMGMQSWADEIYRKVTKEDKIRFADRYAAYKAGEEMPVDGTPIAECLFATPADIASCKAERILSLETLAELPDEKLQRAHLVGLKYKVIDWLKARKQVGYIGELRDQIEALKKRVVMLETENKELKAAPKPRGRPRKVVNDAPNVGQ